MSSLSLGEYEAARFLIARLTSEAAARPFNAEELGYHWTPSENPVIVRTDDGVEIRSADIIRVSLMLIWESLTISGQDIDLMLKSMGLSVAMARPGDAG